MTAPDMESIIAAALAGHNYAFLTVPHDSDGTEITCAGCGISESNPSQTKAEWFAAHQARAVLDALESAGNVEWGVDWPTPGKDYAPLPMSSKPAAEASVEFLAAITPRGNPAPVVVSRMILPWERTE